jgi:hypothetical protein
VRQYLLGALAALVVFWVTPESSYATAVSAPLEPCAYQALLYADFEAPSSGGAIIAGTAGQKIHLCGVRIHPSAAANISLIEGTGSSVCTGGTPAGVYLNTGVTAGNGAAFAATGGEATGFGGGTVAETAAAGDNVCVLFNTANSPQVNVHVSYVLSIQ